MASEPGSNRVDRLTLLKRKQTSSLAAVTRKKNELSSHMTNDNNLHLVKTGLHDYNCLFLEYQKAHAAYFDELFIEQDQEKEDKRFRDHEDAIYHFAKQLNTWISDAECRLSDQMSEVHSRRTHVSRQSSSRSGSSGSARAREKAKLAALLVEAEQQAAQQELQRKKQALESEQQSLQLKIEIDKARAREQAYAEDDKRSRVHSNATKSHRPAHVDPQQYVNPAFSSLNPSAADFRPFTNTNHYAPKCTIDLQQQLFDTQRQQNEHILTAHQQLATAISLPQPEVQKFCGNVIDYNSFIMAFNARIVSRTITCADRLYYLDQHLEGEPKDLIGGCLYMEPTTGYYEAKSLLEKEYGDPYKISVAYIDKILSWPNIKHDDSHALKKFGIFLTRCLKAMQNISHMNVLNHLPHLQAIIQKLPSYLQTKWRDHVNKFRHTEKRVATFSDLVTFIDYAAESANDPVFGREALNKSAQLPKTTNNRVPSRPVPKSRTSSFAVTGSTMPTPNTPFTTNKRRCYYCQKQHDLDECHNFLAKTMEDRRAFIMDKKMCFACYGYNHTSKGCLRKRTCKLCGKKHPTAMHMDSFQPTRQDPPSTVANNVATTCAITNSNDSLVLHAIIPVNVYQKGKSVTIRTYAFYDQGSSGCFLTDDLREQMDASGTDTRLQLRTMHGKSILDTIVVNDLVVTDIHGNNPIDLPKAFTREQIPVEHAQIPKPELFSHWSYLHEATTDMPAYMPDLPIGILIGSNCPKALQPLRVIPSSGDGPYAALYTHGWTINGPMQLQCIGESNQISCHHISVREVESFAETFSPTSILKMFEHDFNDFHTDTVPGQVGPSQEDLTFMKRAENSIRHVEGHYELPLPFRDVNTLMPNNRHQAIKRANWQKKKMMRDQKYHDDYVIYMNNLLAKGYAMKVPSNHLQCEIGKVWYLPHHAVYHPMKPNKIRVVFDCSASYEGTTLNSHLLQGPDLTNSLLGVLTRFRQEPIAFMGDIESMFHQVRVCREHHNFLRFMWWPDGDLSLDLEEYYMVVHLFGATSSPSIANFALRRTADDTAIAFGSQVSDSIRQNFYVDDCLKSVPSIADAVKLIQDLQSACQKGGFKLTKFCCNRLEVLESIPKDERATSLHSRSLDCEGFPSERALGVQWCLNSDSFGFTIKMKTKPSTRRGILSMMSSIYDPLGFVAPFLLLAKKILQDLCREKKLNWDDQVPDEYLTRWNKWLSELHLLEQVNVKRCIKPVDFGKIASTQLHVFSDASSIGYGAVAFLRLSNEAGIIHCSFLLGKARLAPLKVTTIPRLELTAATVAVRIGRQLQRELDIRLDSITFHTDSTTVLHYILNEAKRFPIFVANRVQMIRDHSSVQQWRYVDTKHNPADCSSRGLDGHGITENQVWLFGPDFLWEPESSWPEQPILSKDYKLGDSSVVVTSASITIDESIATVTTLIEHYSNWYRLKRAIAIYLKVFKLLNYRVLQRLKPNAALPLIDSTLTVVDVTQAETRLLIFTQYQHFSEVMNALEKYTKSTDPAISNHRNRVPRNSSVYKLDPFLQDGLLRVGGRLSKMDMADEMKFPILLPYKCAVTTLVIQDIHKQLAHAGRNHTVAQLRERFWVVHANSAVRQLLSKCVTCRRLRKPVCEQKMSDLPPDRGSMAPPFTFTGVDYFGPFMIKQGRKEVKQYGVIFTCMASRAVHIETAKSLDTDSFINALRRFLARRGPVSQIRSDNGTNFVGAQRELREALNEMKNDAVKQMLMKQNIEWIFNPPAGSHFGGVWERQIRTVRKVLAQLSK